MYFFLRKRRKRPKKNDDRKRFESFNSSSRFRRPAWTSTGSELLQPLRPPSVPLHKPHSRALTLRSRLHAPQHVLRTRHIKQTIRTHTHFNLESSPRIKINSITLLHFLLLLCLWHRSAQKEKEKKNRLGKEIGNARKWELQRKTYRRRNGWRTLLAATPGVSVSETKPST